ncbi:hypothetical protein [Shewanella sp.]|uniref:hypothetical protein n=1 Tax=Shewanella sp. TaxID=50422 RepID=UPI004047913F
MDEYENIFEDEAFMQKWGTTAVFTFKDPAQEETHTALIGMIAPLYKMTEEQILAFRKKNVVQQILYKDENERKIKAEVRELRAPEDIQTQLITICIDKDLPQAKAVETQYKVMDKIISAKYKWLVNGTYTFEYFGKEGWNPHIHIKIDKTTKGSTIAQMIRRKLEPIPTAYRVNVITRSAKEHDGYILGEKRDEKQESLQYDKMFKEQFNIKDYYIIN